MKSRNAITFLLSLTLACSGCATGTHRARSGTTPVVQDQVGSSGLLSRSAVTAGPRRGSARQDQNPTGTHTAREKTIVSVGYLEDDQTRLSRESKIDFSALEDGESTSPDLTCSSNETVRDDSASDEGSGSQLSPPTALPFESDFAPTAWTGVTIDLSLIHI